MGNLTAHFDREEFTCPCGCNRNSIDMRLVNRLEQLHDLMGAKAIIVTSGYRCPTHSVRVGGSTTDAHTKGYAADIKVQKSNGEWYSAEDIAEAAERIGFGGIGLMSGACHCDIRDLGGYKNSHWFGDERTGNDNIETFQRGTKFPSRSVVQSHSIKVIVDGKEVYNSTF